MSSFDPASYGPVIADLLDPSRRMPLDPGVPDEAARPALEALTDDGTFAPHSVIDADMAASCRSALWLYHDFLDVSHTLSQGILTPTGSYWHGIMHRREPDYSNCKYWFRKVGAHPVFERLHAEASALASAEASLPAAAAFLTAQASWDPFAFIDLCEASLAGRAPCAPLCRRIQQREWELLFDYCYRRAISG